MGTGTGICHPQQVDVSLPDKSYRQAEKLSTEQYVLLVFLCRVSDPGWETARHRTIDFAGAANVAALVLSLNQAC